MFRRVQAVLLAGAKRLQAIPWQGNPVKIRLSPSDPILHPTPAPIVLTEKPRVRNSGEIFADMGEKCGEKMAKLFADFRPSISRKSERKKFHEKLATNSAVKSNSFTARLWEFGGTTIVLTNKQANQRGLESQLPSSTGPKVPRNLASSRARGPWHCELRHCLILPA